MVMQALRANRTYRIVVIIFPSLCKRLLHVTRSIVAHLVRRVPVHEAVEYLGAYSIRCIGALKAFAGLTVHTEQNQRSFINMYRDQYPHVGHEVDTY